MANGIFISYRRSDSAGHAGRLYDRLEEYYGSGVFRDIEDMVAGDDFVQTINDTIARIDVMLVVIGPGWLAVTDERGKRRLDDPNDVVLQEISAALTRPDVRVIPVLVQEASMPSAGELPAAITPLAQRHAHELLDTRFNDDVDRLIKSLGGRRAGWLKNAVVTGLAATIVALAVGIVMTSMISAEEIVADVTLYAGGGELTGSGRDDITPFATPPDSSSQLQVETNEYTAPFTVTYDYQRRNDNAIRIQSALPYRNLLLDGGPIEGGRAALYWDWPRLSVKIVNNSDRVVQFSEIDFHVRESLVDTEPLVMIKTELDKRATFGIINHGWGPLVDPEIAIAIVEEAQCDNDWIELPLEVIDANGAQTIWFRYTGTESGPPGSPGIETLYRVGDRIPARLRNDLMACVFGTLEYRNEQGNDRSVRFKTLIMLNGTIPHGAVSVSAEYLVFLEAGKSDYTKTRPVAIEVEPGTSEHFLIRIGTDMSASFDLSVTLRAVGEDPIDVDDVFIDILTPVYDPDQLREQARRR